ncbi:hypothetical protein ACFO3D_13425 [Virgibacillus kekensis]|uniref:Uncharacterized protein n=1 Tax=Virgibacillus kekensis TaxID=202261 RepID=A0ABV9DLH7_9BACI
MNKKIIITLLAFLAFLLWLFYAIYFSSGNEWWTVIQVKPTSYDTAVGVISPVKVIIGAGIFTLVGFLIYSIINKL